MLLMLISLVRSDVAFLSLMGKPKLVILSVRVKQSDVQGKNLKNP